MPRHYGVSCRLHHVENRITGLDIGEAQMVGYAHGTIDRRLRDLCPLFSVYSPHPTAAVQERRKRYGVAGNRCLIKAANHSQRTSRVVATGMALVRQSRT